MNFFQKNLMTDEKSFLHKTWNFGKKISISCWNIAFWPVEHFILSHPVFSIGTGGDS